MPDVLTNQRDDHADEEENRGDFRVEHDSAVLGCMRARDVPRSIEDLRRNFVTYKRKNVSNFFGEFSRKP